MKMASTAAAAAGDAPAAVSDPKKQVRLESGDHQVFSVDIEAAKKSKVIKEMLENLTGEDDTSSRDWSLVDPLTLPNVSGPILEKIVTWMKHHVTLDEPELPADDLSHFTDEISEWDQEFVKVDSGTLFELIVASNYLNIKKMRTVCCKTVAAELKRLSVEEIRAKYNIENDFTPEEEEQIRRENEWCEDQDAPK